MTVGENGLPTSCSGLHGTLAYRRKVDSSTTVERRDCELSMHVARRSHLPV